MAYEATETEVKPPKTLPEEVQRWQERISLAKKDLETWSESSGAKRFLKEYEGDYGVVLWRNIKAPAINEVYAYVESSVANLYFRDPYIAVNPKKSGSIAGAAIWEAWMNYQWREMKTKEEIELEIKDCELVGFGWHKTGMAIESEGTGETLKIMKQDMYSSRLSWRDVYFNLNSVRPPYDCQWMAQRIIRPLEDIKAKYPNAKNMRGTCHPYVKEDDFKAAKFQDDILLGVMYEVWDARTKQIRLLGEGIEDQYLEDPKPWPDYLDEFPFLMYWNFAIPDKPRPMSSIAPWEEQAKEEIILMAQGVNHIKRWNRQAFVKQGAMTPEGMDKFERGDDGAILEVGGQTLGDILKMVDFGQLPTDFYLMMDRISQVIRRMNGNPEVNQGGTTKTQSRTKYELQAIQGGAQDRTNRKIDRLETHLENIARHMMAHMKAHFNLEQVVQITGDTPEQVIQAFPENKFNPETGTLTFTPEDIQGEYDVEVKAGSTLSMDKETRRRIYETILQTIGPVVSRGPVGPFMKELVVGILDDYDVKKLEVAFQQEQDQAAQAAEQAAQAQKLEQAKVYSETEKRIAQAGETDAKTAQIEQEIRMAPKVAMADMHAQLVGAMSGPGEEAPPAA